MKGIEDSDFRLEFRVEFAWNLACGERALGRALDGAMRADYPPPNVSQAPVKHDITFNSRIIGIMAVYWIYKYLPFHPPILLFFVHITTLQSQIYNSRSQKRLSAEYPTKVNVPYHAHIDQHHEN